MKLRNRVLAASGTALALSGAAVIAQALTVAPVQAAPAGVRQPAASSGWRISTSIRDEIAAFTSIDADKGGDAWAVGYTESVVANRVVIEHWTGKAWRRVRLPAKLLSGISEPPDFVGPIGVQMTSGFSATGTACLIRRSPDARWRRPDSTAGTGGSTVCPVRAILERLACCPRTTSGPSSAIQRTESQAQVHAPRFCTGMARPGERRRFGLSCRPGPSCSRSPRPQIPIWVGGTAPNSRHGSYEVIRHWNGRAWADDSPVVKPTRDQPFVEDLVPDGTGGIWELALSGKSSEPSRLRHFSHGRWVASVDVERQLFQLAAVPGTDATWGVGMNPDGTRGLVVLHGPKPR